MSRVIIVMAALLAAGTSAAEELNAEAAQQFVAGRLFTFRCFEGTRGIGRIYADGSVAGTVQLRGIGAVHSVVLPAGTVHVQNEAICASVPGVPFQPCFTVDQMDSQSFRGSVSGLRFAYCDFTRRDIRPAGAATADGPRIGPPIRPVGAGVVSSEDGR
jgi:hypothetical protein